MSAIPSLSQSKEPVLVVHTVTAVLAWVATFLVGHGVFTGVRATAMTQTVAPTAVLTATMGLGLLVRRFVSPAAVVAVAKADELGLAEVTGHPEVITLLAELGMDPTGAVLAVPVVPEP